MVARGLKRGGIRSHVKVVAIKAKGQEARELARGQDGGEQGKGG